MPETLPVFPFTLATIVPNFDLKV